MNIIKSKKFRAVKVVSSFLIYCLLICGCGSSDDKNKSFSKTYLSELCQIIEEKGVEIMKDGNTVSMGGKEYCGGILLGTLYGDNENCFLKFDLSGKEIQNISFYLGSVHSENVYFKNSEQVSVFVGEDLVVQKTIYNHDLPTFYTLNVENADTISFATESESVIVALGELIAWKGDVSIPNETSFEELTTAKLMQDIRPYYKSGEASLFCAYSENGDTVELDGNEYTDALRVFFPKIEKWSNDVFACFNLSGEYETFSFKTGIYMEDVETEISAFATICIYADGELIFEENITSKDVKGYRVPINKCEKLTLVCKSIPDVPDLKLTFVSMFVEK
ncbi:MAG: hypothetical protein E7614_06870 [Ruminococcaceae bacterium]|nr:hypothetical protein [Oscillospiraceae bacterium]